MFKPVTYIYESENGFTVKNFTDTAPLQLYVTVKKVKVLMDDSDVNLYKEITVHGMRNPLPFTKTIVEESSVDLDKWLYDTPYKYKKIGVIHH